MVVRTVAQTAQQLGACRLARFAWTKLRTMPFPPEWRVLPFTACLPINTSTAIPCQWHVECIVFLTTCANQARTDTIILLSNIVHKQTQVDMATVMAKGLPMTDAEELLPVCFRCGATNNLAGYQESLAA